MTEADKIKENAIEKQMEEALKKHLALKDPELIENTSLIHMARKQDLHGQPQTSN